MVACPAGAFVCSRVILNCIFFRGQLVHVRAHAGAPQLCGLSRILSRSSSQATELCASEIM